MTLAGAKEYFKKAESDLECRTDALQNKKQKKSNNSLFSAARSWNVNHAKLKIVLKGFGTNNYISL